MEIFARILRKIFIYILTSIIFSIICFIASVSLMTRKFPPDFNQLKNIKNTMVSIFEKQKNNSQFSVLSDVINNKKIISFEESDIQDLQELMSVYKQQKEMVQSLKGLNTMSSHVDLNDKSHKEYVESQNEVRIKLLENQVEQLSQQIKSLTLSNMDLKEKIEILHTKIK